VSMRIEDHSNVREGSGDVGLYTEASHSTGEGCQVVELLEISPWVQVSVLSPSVPVRVVTGV
jgi:hypothetical protein